MGLRSGVRRSGFGVSAVDFLDLELELIGTFDFSVFN